VWAGAVTSFKAMKAARPDAKPDDKLFTENHREVVKELLIKAKLYRCGRPHARFQEPAPDRDLALELGPNPDYRDIVKWARTSPAMIAAFYDQTHPQHTVERIVGFRKHPNGSKKDDASGVESE
jgi:hypothetical protein